MTLYGIMAEFDTGDDVRKAAERVYAAGYRRFDAFSPYPVEDLNEAVGFSHSRMPLIILIGGLTGCAGGYLLQYWAMVLSYPINIGNRPLNSWPAFIPVTFELTVLCAALAGFVGVLASNRLPELYHPVFNVPAFARASSDRFFICIQAQDAGFELEKTKAFLNGLIRSESTMCRREGRSFYWVLGLALLTGCRHGMEVQPKLKAMQPSSFFADGRGARPQVPGTIARGQPLGDSALDTGMAKGQYITQFPLPLTPELLARGRERYDIFCAVCHDRVGTGDGIVVQRGLLHPPSFHSDRLRQAPVGHFFDVITRGYGAMYAYNDRVPVDDRWAIVAYIRALQLSQHATAADLSPEDRQRLGGGRS